MRKLLAFAGILSLGAAAPSVANAAVTTGVESPLCIYWGSYSACASVFVNTTDNTVKITNLSGVEGNTWYKLTGFGFYYFPEPTPDAITFTALSLDPGWANDADGGLTGVLGGEDWAGGASTTSGVNNAIDFGASRTFTFNPDTPDADWDNLYFGWRGQAWADEAGAQVGSGSIKCFQTGEASSQGGDVESFCEPPTVVPEPATMALLATGLVGLGGAGLIRRRRQNS